MNEKIKKHVLIILVYNYSLSCVNLFVLYIDAYIQKEKKDYLNILFQSLLFIRTPRREKLRALYSKNIF